MHGLIETNYEASHLEGELGRLCDAPAEISRTICFVIDQLQANAPDESDRGRARVSNENI